MGTYLIIGCILSLPAAFIAFVMAAKRERYDPLEAGSIAASVTAACIAFFWPFAIPLGLAIAGGILYHEKQRKALDK